MEYRNAATITPAPRRQQYCPYDAPILLSPGSTTYSRVPDYLFVGSSIGVAHLPTRPIAEAGLADISGELLWKVSGGLMMGFTAGREQIPHFDIQAQGDSMVYTQINAVTFAGMALRYSLPLNKATYLPTFFRDCSLQTSFTGAGSSSGGVLRVGVGLSYPLNPLFDLHLGTTLNALVFRNKGSYQTAERIGIGMGIGFRF
ncbi:MAG: hypothetical protein JNL32_10925 [Candidatus Kapabacteria bacterium]|nr:hypothetical protein [Candidatus Kapabacteria bacterium]